MYLEERIKELETALGQALRRIERLEMDRSIPIGDNDYSSRFAAITQRICLDFNMPASVLFGARRDVTAVWPRHLSIYLVREATCLNYNALGVLFKRDHGSILHAIKCVKDNMETDPKRAQVVRDYSVYFNAKFSGTGKN